MANHALSLPIVHVADVDLPVIIYRDLRVIVTETLAQLYCVEPVRIRQNQARNDERFIEGKHFFRLEGDELSSFKLLSCLDFPHVKTLVLWTERGAARHAKLLENDRSWEVFEALEDSYFEPKASVPTAVESLKSSDLDKHLRRITELCDQLENAKNINSFSAQARLRELRHRCGLIGWSMPDLRLIGQPDIFDGGIRHG